jgi:indolepyruvate ferredoxin oxidoreductase
MEARIEAVLGTSRTDFVDATKLASVLLGDSIGANLFLVGFALQKGLIPVGLPALERAIELNGRSIDMNKRALSWGRLAAHDYESVRQLVASRGRPSDAIAPADSLEERVARRARFLTAYQNEAYAVRYADRVTKVVAAERAIGAPDHRLAEAVAQAYFKLLAVKDEYEVMRLWANDSFTRQLESEFEGDYKLEFHLAPQLFFPRNPDTGRVRKRVFHRHVFSILKLLRHLKFLRHTPLDIFNRTAHRRREWALLADFERLLDEVLLDLRLDNLDLAVEIAEIPQKIRGFDTVKDEQARVAKEKEAGLVARFRATVGASSERPRPA